MAEKKLGVNPWTSIWFKPRNTIQQVVDYNPKYRFLILSFLYGLPMLLHMAQNLSLGDNFATLGIVIAAVVCATFVGMLGITIASALFLWTGKWIGGQGSYHKIRAAVSFANVPNILVVIVWAVMIATFHKEIFIDGFEEMQFAGRELAIVSGGIIVQLIASIWSFIILVKSLGQVQGFSAWKGVLNVLIPFFMVGILIWVIGWLFWVGNGMPGVA